MKRDYVDTDYHHYPPEPKTCPKCKEGYMIREFWWSNWFICTKCEYGENIEDGER